MTFEYKKRPESAVREASTVQMTKFFTYIKPGIKIWNPTKSVHVIRVMPATYSGPIKSFGKEVVIHSNVGPDERNVLCLKAMKGEPDPIEELLESARDSGKAQQPWAKSLKAKVRVATWIIDRDDEAAGPQLFIMAQQTDATLNRRCLHEKSGKVVEIENPDKGYDVEMITTKDNNGYTVYEFELASRSSYLCEDERLQEEWLEYITVNAPDKILVFDSYEAISSMIRNVGDVRPARTADREQFSRTSRRGSAPEEFGSELPSWASAEPEPEERPARTSRRAAEPEPEERPARTSRRAAEPEPEERPARTSRRAAEPEEVEERPARASRRAAEPEEVEERPARASRRAAEPEDLRSDVSRRASRRAAEPEEVEEPEERPARTSRRAAEPEEVEERPARTSRRAAEPEPEERPARASRRAAEPEPEERPARASRRAAEPEEVEEPEERPARASRRVEQEELPEPEPAERPARASRRAEPEEERPARASRRAEPEEPADEERAPRRRRR